MDEINNSPTGLTDQELQLLESVLADVHNENVLPVNSPTLLVDESSSRFSSAIWFEEIGNQDVTLAGLGGIGSYVAYLLGRLKVNSLILYDDDSVDETNLSGQLYSAHDIGDSKTAATCRNLRIYSNFYNIFTRGRFNSTSSPTDIMICGFDNMAARKDFFNSWKTRVMLKSSTGRGDCLYIDGRLSAEEFQVFCIKGTDTFLMDKYEKEWLFSDEEAEETICSYKQTSFCANMIASVMVNLFVNFIANKCNPIIERELPFCTCYDAERMYFKTEMV